MSFAIEVPGRVLNETPCLVCRGAQRGLTHELRWLRNFAFGCGSLGVLMWRASGQAHRNIQAGMNTGIC